MHTATNSKQEEVPKSLRVRIRALDYNTAGALGNKWEVPKKLHVRMRACCFDAAVEAAEQYKVPKKLHVRIRARDQDVPVQTGKPRNHGLRWRRRAGEHREPAAVKFRPAVPRHRAPHKLAQTLDGRPTFGKSGHGAQAPAPVR